MIEKTMMDVMYEAPSNENMKKCGNHQRGGNRQRKTSCDYRRESGKKAGTFLQKTGNQESRKTGNRLTGGNR